MTRSKVIKGQIVIVILVNLFQILFEQVRFNYNQTWIIGTLSCTMGTFTLWCFSRSHDKVKGHWRSNCYSYLTSNCYSYLTSNCYRYGCPFYASAPKVPEALCFRVVRPSGFFCLRDNSSITWWNFIKLGQKVKLDVTINWLDFGWNPPNVKGQRSIWSKYAISTSFTQNQISQEPLGGFSSNLVQGCTTRSRWTD